MKTFAFIKYCIIKQQMSNPLGNDKQMNAISLQLNRLADEHDHLMATVIQLRDETQSKADSLKNDLQSMLNKLDSLNSIINVHSRIVYTKT